jgi:hypothetical protein
MPTYIDLTNLSPATITALSSTAPTITQVQITTSAYVVKDDTAVSTSGGYIKITGTNFTAGTQVVIGSVTATSVTFVNSTTLNVQVPAQAAGTYIIYVTVSNGGVAILVNGLTYSGDPTWVTGSTLPAGQVGSAISIQFSATGDAPLTYALQAGSTLPAGLTLSSGGLLSGTVTGITSETTYNFTVEAIDAQAQESPRAFSITISASDPYFEYVTTLLSASNPANTFVTDASTNNFAVTVNGDTRPNNFNPYTPGYYSNYFDGTGDYLSTPTNAAFDIKSVNFTIEFWMYSTLAGATQFIIRRQGMSGSYAGWSVRKTSGNQISFDVGTAQSPLNSSSTVGLGTWTHVAVVNLSSTITIYLNGISSGSTTLTALTEDTGSLFIGGTDHAASECFSGYLSNVRIVKGTAVYTSNFTPSTTPLTAIANTQLLTCQSNRFIDNSTNNFVITRVGDTSISGFDPFAPLSAYSTYGSGYFDGTGDYLTVASNVATTLNADFTIEFWVYTGTGNNWFFSLGDTFTTSGIEVYIGSSGTLFNLYSNGASRISSATLPTPNAWSHIAAVRSGTTVTLYLNGNSVGTWSSSATFSGTTYIGAEFYNGSITATFTGYISNFRILKGTALYTANFVPSTVPLSAIANTSLLTLQNNQPNNNNMFLDSSSNNFLITRNGNTTQGSFSPYGGGWSNYFGGDGNQIYTPYNSAFDFGTGNFSVEAWVYPIDAGRTNDANKYGAIVSGGLSGSTTNLWASTIRIVGTNVTEFFFGWGATTLLNVTGLTVPINTWHHFVICRTGTTLSAFIDGVRVGTVTDSTSINTNSSGFVMIARSVYASNFQNWLSGYISNVRIIKGSQPYDAASSTITVPTAPLTPIANTSLLTCADNRFIDDSANNFPITREGTPSIQRFNPFNPVLTTPTSYSGYFDGTGDYLEVPANSAFDFGSGDFTIECWAYIAGNSTAAISGIRDAILFSNDDDISGAVVNGSVCLQINGSASTTGTGILFYRRQTSGAYAEEFSYTGTIAQNTWHHIAVTKSGSTVRIFLNGSQVVSQTATNTTFGTSSKVNTIADRRVTNYRNDLNGYISNMRIVKGTAVYTSSFTPSTTPLTAISGTSLLTCQNATFRDNSTNNFTITAYGDSVPRQFNPFGWTNTTGSNAVYSVANYGGGMYFDGTGDFLTTNYAINWSTLGSYTFETWVYYPTLSANNMVFASTGGTGYTNFYIYGSLGAYPGAIAVGISGTNEIRSANGAIVANAWIHVAYTYNGTTTKIYVNGVSVASGTTAVYSNNSANLTIGNGLSNNYLAGYLANMRLVRGQVLYTSNFAPPVAPLSFNANATLQVNGTGAAIYDSAMITTYETLGNASSTGALKKYGNSSLYFDGTGDYLSTTASTNFGFGTGDFTIEFWLYLNSTALQTVVSLLTTASSTAPHIYIAAGGSIRYYTASADRITGSTLATGTWYHVALSRSGSSTKMFINGTQAGSTYTDTNNYGASNPFLVANYGSPPNNADMLNGYIDDLRITRGVARYTANFTPPTTPFIQF